MIKVFDLDGTLLDSNGIWRQIDETFVGRHGFALTDEYNEFVAHAIFPAAAQFTRSYYHLEESEEEIMAAWLALARDAYAHQLPLKENAAKYLAQCRASGERMALFTSGEPSLCRSALARHGITDYFETLFFAQELNLEKKYADSFRALSGLMGEAPEECVLFDDSPVACASAKQAGWQVVGVWDSFFDDQRETMEQLCDRFITGFGELLQSEY